MALTKASFSMIQGAPVNVFDFMTPAQILDVQSGAATLDVTDAIQAAVDQVVAFANDIYVGGSVVNPTDLVSPNFVVFFPTGKYLINQANGVQIPVQVGTTTQASLHFESSQSGAAITGNETNIGFNFTGGAYRNKFSNIAFGKFATAIKLNYTNKNESMLQVDSCRSQSNDIFIDTVSYAVSRSTMIDIRNTMCGDTRVFVNHYTDHMTIRDCWIYAKKDSYDALLYLSGDGNVNLYDNFMIPFGSQIPNPQNARWIDFVSESAQSTMTDRSVKFLNIRGTRCSLESARPFIWTYSDTPPGPPNAISSITIEDSYIGGTGGASVITYKTGYPGSVNLKNCKVLSAPLIVSVDAANTTYPEPSAAIGGGGFITYHTIMVDEATRLSQNNSFTINLGNLIDPKLMPFYVDTTTQTSKYKTTFPWEVPSDYRMRTVAGTAGNVKVVFPIFFDYNPAVPNRDICSFLLVTVSDAQVGGASTVYRSQATSLVTITGLYSAPNDVKKINATTLQNALGGFSAVQSAVPTIFWGSGSTGSNEVVYTGAGNPELSITVEWPGTDTSVCWSYIIPLSGIRPNQPSLQQFNVW